MSQEQVLLYEVLNPDFQEMLKELKDNFRYEVEYDFNFLGNIEDCSEIFSKNALLWDDKYSCFTFFHSSNSKKRSLLSEGVIVLFHVGLYPNGKELFIKNKIEKHLGLSNFSLYNEGDKDKIILNALEKNLIILRQFQLSDFMKEHDLISGHSLQSEIYYYFTQIKFIHEFTMEFMSTSDHSFPYGVCNPEDRSCPSNFYHKSLLKALGDRFPLRGKNIEKTSEDKGKISNFVQLGNESYKLEGTNDVLSPQGQTDIEEYAQYMEYLSYMKKYYRSHYTRGE